MLFYLREPRERGNGRDGGGEEGGGEDGFGGEEGGCLDPRSHRNAGLQPLLHAHVIREEYAPERLSL